MFTGINLLGVRWLAETNRIAVLWKIAIPVLTVIVLVFVVFRPSNFGIGVISRLGRYDGAMIIPEWYDLALVALWSLIIYFVSIRMAMAPELVAEQVRGEEQERRPPPGPRSGAHPVGGIAAGCGRRHRLGASSSAPAPGCPQR